MNVRTHHGPRDLRGAAMTEYVVVVTLLAIGVMPLVLAFGHRLCERYAGTSAALDHGRALRYAPVAMAEHDPSFAIEEDAGTRLRRTDSRAIRPEQDPGGPYYSHERFPGQGEDLYRGHSLGNMDGVWSPRRLLDRTTQYDAPDRPELRCAPTTAVAATLMHGPEAFERLVRNLRRDLILGHTPSNPGASGGRTRAEAEESLSEVLRRIENRSLTREDVGQVTDLLARFGQAEVDRGSGMNESVRMMHLGSAGERRASEQPASGPDFRRWIHEELRPGEVVRTSIDADGDANGFAFNNHAILVGKDACGREYLYDPLPKAEDRGQVVYLHEDPEQYAYYLDKMLRYDPNSKGEVAPIVGGKIFSY